MSIETLPLADGGEGTVNVLVDATDGRIIKVKVHDPLMRITESCFGMLGDRETAVIEMAAASGLEMLKPVERNPWITSTYGTGELIRFALDAGCRRIILGMGGSATNDGGAGAVSALGVRLLDGNGKILSPGGGALGNLATIDRSGLDKRLEGMPIIAASDVSNPLTGPNGASYVFGPQKGAGPDMVRHLDENLQHFARLIQMHCTRDVENTPGSGAAGGLGAGLTAFLNIIIRPGFDIVSEITKLEEKIKWADLVITGEGKIDFQTQFGKTPYGVGRLALRYHKPVIALAGSLGQGHEMLYEKGIRCIVPVVDRPMDLDYALTHAGLLIEEASGRVIRLLELGGLLGTIV
jgi:glycerate kinase